ncbi:MAG: hypothetical protein ACXAC8_11425 [Candidatus Hodarchaeales archaeon]|jgi:hypothetical protein
MSPRIKRKSPKSNTNSLPTPPSLFDQKDNFVRPPSNLPPPPPTIPQDILARPPFPESQSPPFSDERGHLVVSDDITDDILTELRDSDFGSFLKDVTLEKPPEVSVKEVKSTHFSAARDAYVAAGKKHLEMDFFENAAMNYSCAILCEFLGNDVFVAAHLIAELATEFPSAIVNSYVFQGVKLLLKANLLKNSSFLIQAEKWLLKDPNHLYKEDIELINRALRESVENLKRR